MMIILLYIILLSSGNFPKRPSPFPGTYFPIDTSHENDINLGTRKFIYSNILEDRIDFKIYKPTKYIEDESKQNYPIIYLLDGSSYDEYVHVVGAVEYLIKNQIIEPCIVVAIETDNGIGDYVQETSVASDTLDMYMNCNSSKFIQSLEKEVIPYIEETYHSYNRRTIIGQDYGALLASEIIIKYPNLFDNFVLVNPNIGWNDSYLVKNASNFFSYNNEAYANVYLFNSNDTVYLQKSIKDLAKEFQKNTSKNKQFKFTYENIKTEKPDAIYHESIIKALKKFHKYDELHIKSNK